MGVTVTLVMRPTIEALGRDWPKSGWRRLVELAAEDGARQVVTNPTATAGLRLHRTNQRLYLVPVIGSGGARTPEGMRQIRRNLHSGSGTLWLSDPTLRALNSFVLIDEKSKALAGARGRWRRCLPIAVASKEVGALLPPVDGSDPFWRQLDALHCGSFFRFDSKAEIARNETIVAIGDVEEEDTDRENDQVGNATEVAASVARGAFAGWWNPIVLQFSPDDRRVTTQADVAALLGDPAALLDLQVARAGQHAGAVDGALAARFWLHEALRERALKAGIANAPLPRLVFGPNAQRKQALAFLLLDLEDGTFLLDVASGCGAPAAAWLAPTRDKEGAKAETRKASTVADWLRATCRARLGVEAAAPDTAAPEPIKPVALDTNLGISKHRTGGGAPKHGGPAELAAMAESLSPPSSLSALAHALDHWRNDKDPGTLVAAEAAAVLREALAPGVTQAGGRVAQLDNVAREFALPRSAILLRFPDPPDALDLAQRSAWQAQAERYCISLTDSVRAPGYWWLIGLGEAPAAGSAEPSWNVHEVHWAARLYRAAFVQAAPNWRPSWYVGTEANLGEALLGEMILGGGGGRPRDPVLPGHTRFANVLWNVDQEGRP